MSYTLWAASFTHSKLILIIRNYIQLGMIRKRTKVMAQKRTDEKKEEEKNGKKKEIFEYICPNIITG